MENKNDKPMQGLRFNKGKVRHDLLEPFAMNELAKVFTRGAEKYAAHNWLGSMNWSTMLASMKRHINAFERGEDFDPETGDTLHMAHVAWNALGIVSYYKYHPEKDDRLHHIMPKKKVGFDIDEVLADWTGHWCKRHNQPIPQFWNFDRFIMEKFEEAKNDKEFWMTIPPKIDPSTLPLEPHCYITSRVIPKEWTELWLHNMGFPAAPVYSIGHNESKVEVAKKAGIDWFVDDRYENYLELNRAGICCWLMDAPHNQRYQVGFRRIKSLADLPI